MHPSIVELKAKPKITIDREHVKFVWINPEEIRNYDIVPNAAESLKRVI